MIVVAIVAHEVCVHRIEQPALRWVVEVKRRLVVPVVGRERKGDARGEKSENHTGSCAYHRDTENDGPAHGWPSRVRATMFKRASISWAA
jgi:hypothetical protein